MELLQAVVEAFEEEKVPVMLQILKGARQHGNPFYLKTLIEAAIGLTNIAIPVHLDHGDTYELCKECIEESFTSVLIDGSHLPLDKNVALCKRVVEYAHKHNCVVEGELGQLVGAQCDGGREGDRYSKGGVYTHPEETVEFVPQTGLNSLAVAIGNSGGGYQFRSKQHLDLNRLKPLGKALLEAGLGDYPVVLHRPSSGPKGLVPQTSRYRGSLSGDTAGVPVAYIEVARCTSVTRVNIDDDLRLAMTGAPRKVTTGSPKELDPRETPWPGPQPDQGTHATQGERRLVLRRPRLRPTRKRRPREQRWFSDPLSGLLTVAVDAADLGAPARGR
jgi:fructose-bisphosphate aldolase class II